MKTVPFRPRLQPLSIALGLTVGTFGAISAAAASALLSNTAALADEPHAIAPPAAIAHVGPGSRCSMGRDIR
jgi:hypothetical protein